MACLGISLMERLPGDPGMRFPPAPPSSASVRGGTHSFLWLLIKELLMVSLRPRNSHSYPAFSFTSRRSKVSRGIPAYCPEAGLGKPNHRILVFLSLCWSWKCCPIQLNSMELSSSQLGMQAVNDVRPSFSKVKPGIIQLQNHLLGASFHAGPGRRQDNPGQNKAGDGYWS